jgi:hypothetical protein
MSIPNTGEYDSMKVYIATAYVTTSVVVLILPSVGHREKT